MPQAAKVLREHTTFEELYNVSTFFAPLHRASLIPELEMTYALARRHALVLIPGFGARRSLAGAVIRL